MKRNRLPLFAKLLNIILVVSILTQLIGVVSVSAQSGGEAERIFAQLSPEERVGQLFLVSFDGTETSDKSKIYDLITDYHIGGVILRADRDNFTQEFTSTNARELVNSLQRINADNNKPSVPLFIGISQEGGGYPNDQLLSGISSVPNQMAIGATWNTSFAKQVGHSLAADLNALGFNFYYGLSLDVLTSPDPSKNPDLSTRLYGSDPYWVGLMGKAFISGMREAAGDHMTIVAKHFPGSGASDRVAAVEIPTVRKSLEELKDFELAPFFSVTSKNTDRTQLVDGLMVSHIRYQGFQGNIRATTRPISLDQQALTQLLELPELVDWRANGGLMVSDDLGTAAVRNFYDPGQQNFNAKLVVRDAFLAGNDLLMTGSLTSQIDGDNIDTVEKTIQFFAQRYIDDSNFASKVDDSVLRILRQKFRMFGEFPKIYSEPTIESSPTTNILKNDLNFSIAKQAATLINPTIDELTNVIPDPPQSSDYLVFLTATQETKQCTTCTISSSLPIDSFQTTVNRLYGPLADDLVVPSHMASFSFNELGLMLDDRLESKDLINAIGRADWVIISVQDLPEGSSQINTLRRFLNEKQNALSDKKVILFSFGAPYFLGATDISKLTAYYALYDANDAFINLAARILFQEITPIGTSPVSIIGIGYDIINATSPDPKQVISLSINHAQANQATLPDLNTTPEPLPLGNDDPTLQPTEVPVYRVGDTLMIRTGVILDKNHHQVPDGTPVKFRLSSSDEYMQQVEAVTVSGIATSNFRLDKSGYFEITAASEPAIYSEIIQLDVNDQGSKIIIVTPTPDRATLSATPTTASDNSEKVENQSKTTFITDKGFPSFSGWFLVLLVMFAGMFLTYVIANQLLDSRWSIRFAILALIGGLVFYNTIMLAGGQSQMADSLSPYIGQTIFGQFVGVGVAWGWYLLANRGNKAEKK